MGPDHDLIIGLIKDVGWLRDGLIGLYCFIGSVEFLKWWAPARVKTKKRGG
jgi:hypothetical protein